MRALGSMCSTHLGYLLGNSATPLGQRIADLNAGQRRGYNKKIACVQTVMPQYAADTPGAAMQRHLGRHPND